MKKQAVASETSRAVFWRRHVKAWAASGETAAAYARREGVATQSLYQAKHLMERKPRSAKSMPSRRSTFSRVTIREPRQDESGVCFRMRLSSGAVLEWLSAPDPSEIAAMLEQCDRAR